MLGKQDPQRTLLEVELWAGREIVPSDSFYGRFARVADSLVSDETFASCYGVRGRPSVSPALLTKVLLLALHDGCSDRKAIEQMRMHLGWKRALHLALDDPGCHPTTLTVFRARLVLHNLDRKLFVDVVERAVKAGVLAKQAVQAVDSSSILGAGAVQDTYTLLRKALQQVVRAGRRELPSELRQRLARYEEGKKAAIDWDDAAARRAELGRLANDARALLAALPAPTADEAGADEVSERERSIRLARALLEQVLTQDVEDGADGNPQLRTGVARHRVPSTTDPEMRHGRKSARRRWTGYKHHLMTDPESELVTAVTVSPASTGDGALLPELLAQGKDAGLSPSQVVGDQAYGSGALRAALAEDGIEIVAKVAPIANGEFFSKDRFVIDLKDGTVGCPAHHTVNIPSPVRAGQAQRVVFPTELCGRCSLRGQCVRGKGGRSITIAAYEAERQRARTLQRSDHIQALLHLRPRVERKIAHLVRWGGRQARYLGQRKAGLQLFLVGFLANLDRLSRLDRGKPGLIERLAVAH
jgi:transposase